MSGYDGGVRRALTIASLVAIASCSLTTDLPEASSSAPASSGAAASGGDGGSAGGGGNGAGGSDVGGASAGGGGAGGAAAATPTSCRELALSSPGLQDGPYEIDLDGAGALGPLTLYCSFADGGWTLVLHQLPWAQLTADTGDINPGDFGSLSASWRLGETAMTAVQPEVWRMQDATTTVYFSGACAVRWSTLLDASSPEACRTGYDSESLTSTINADPNGASAFGIGLNAFSGQRCSIRAYQAPDAFLDEPKYVGAALPCEHGELFDGMDSTVYAPKETITLWFK